MKKISLLPCLFVSLSLFSQTTNEIKIVPQPVNINAKGQTSRIDFPIIIFFDKAGNNFFNARYLQNELSKRNIPVGIAVPGNILKWKSKIELRINKQSTDGKYDLVIADRSITIFGSDRSIFYGIQTLLQILPMVSENESWNKVPDNKKLKQLITIPQLSITDYPRFPYRGMHLDVSRHFFPPAVVKKYIDYLAYHKFNTFHWHLTEDQGWRIEIKKYPKLTSVGGYRNGTIIGRNPGKGNDSTRYGGFYTQEEIKDIVKYAADRYITVIPEIEMPGHSSAAIAAYPELSCFPDEPTLPAKGTAWAGPRTGKQVQQAWGVFEDVFCPTDYTFNFLENVLDEVMKLFPSKYIHIGGDECPKSSWKRSAFCQQLIKEKGLKDEHELQSYFVRRIEKYLNSKGRNIIGWDEILEGGLAPNATVMSWRGEKGGIEAAKQKHNVVMTPEAYMYFNMSQSTHEDSLTYGQYTPVEKVYNYEPVPKDLDEEEAKYVLGAQGNVWTEYIDNPKRLEYMIFPRISALSEVLWSPTEKRSWNDFEKKLPALFKRYEQWGAQYSMAYYELRPSILPSPNYDGVLWKLESNNKDGNIIYVAGRAQSATRNYTNPILITGTREIGAALTRKDHTFITSWLWQKFSFNKATGKKITLTNPPMGNWVGSGAFTLVNGVITEQKLSQSKEWLGFLGKDLEATIDLGKDQYVDSIVVNVLEQNNSWIYLPKSVTVVTIDADDSHTPTLRESTQGHFETGTRRIVFPIKRNIRSSIRVIVRNYGIIPEGKPGAGTPAWLFADEIEVK